MSKLAFDPKNIKAFVFDVDGVLSDSTLLIADDGQPLRTTNLKDGYSIRVALEAGYKVAIITGCKTEPIVNRFNLLGIKDVFIRVSKKIPVLEKWLADSGLTADQIAYMGDDIPDLPCLRIAGLPAAPADASAEVLETAVFISKHPGGHGCVRDLIE
ncbi:MAG: 3-deoxy-D-manno-octulosonate 8-phosphate phosphatase, partial [Muribaculaceae bacterium]|nr:3-deoxy-D-manno-octulosonate 8-phosphate phosphatase [Muribaculaceae bacterium]